MAFGIVYKITDDGHVDYNHYVCTVKREIIPHAFELSTLVFFVAPMSLISVLYVLIALQLRRSKIVRRGSLAQSVELKVNPKLLSQYNTNFYFHCIKKGSWTERNNFTLDIWVFFLINSFWRAVCNHVDKIFRLKIFHFSLEKNYLIFYTYNINVCF